MSPDLEAVLRRINPPEKLQSLEDVRRAVNSPDCYSVVEKKFYEDVVQLFADLAASKVPGDILATGVWKGGSALYLQALNRHFGLNRRLWLSDTFSGFVHERISHKKDQWALRLLSKFVNFEHPDNARFPSAADVEQLFQSCELWDERVQIVQGPLEATLPSLEIESLCFVHIDVDLYEPTRDALEFAYPRLRPGGYVVVDDYGAAAFNCKEAVDEFRAQHAISAPMRFMTTYAVCWQKPHV